MQVADAGLYHGRAGIAVFLVSYFRSFWVHGIRLLPIIAVQTGLAVAFTPINLGAGVLFVYAAATAGRNGRYGSQSEEDECAGCNGHRTKGLMGFLTAVPQTTDSN